MKEAQIISAFSGEISIYDKHIEYEKHYAPIGIHDYEINNIKCEVHFLFNKNKQDLEAVHINVKNKPLELPKATFRLLEKLLIEKYGPPTNSKNENPVNTTEWVFPSTKIEILFIDLGSSSIIKIMYSSPKFDDLDKL